MTDWPNDPVTGEMTAAAVARGLEELDRGRFDLAVSSLDDAVQSSSDREEYFELLVPVYEALLAEDGADPRQVPELLRFPAVTREVALLALERGRVDQALRWSTDLVEGAPRDPERLDVLAATYAYAGDATGALRVSEQLVSVAPEFVAGYWRRAEARAMHADVEADGDDTEGARRWWQLAAEDLGEVLRREPEFLPALMARAQIYEALEQYQQSIDDYSAIVAADPGLVSAYVARARLHVRTGAFDAAIADYDTVIELDQDSVDAHFERAQALVFLAGASSGPEATQRYGEALASFDEALRLEPTFVSAYVRRADVHARLGKDKATLADYTQAIAVAPDDGRARIARARFHAASGDLAAALADYDRLLEAEPSRVDACFERGQVQALLADESVQPSEAQERYRSALADFDAAVAGDPEFVHAYLKRAEVYERLRDTDSALADYECLIRLEPVLGHEARGASHENAGRYDEALADYDEVVRLAPSANAFRNRADAHFSLGNAEQALGDYTEAIARDAGLSAAYIGRARLQAHDDPASALRDAERALELDPGNLGALTVRGVLLMITAADAADAVAAKGLYQRALDDLRDVLEGDPTFVGGYLYRANVYEALGNERAALADYEELIRLDPGAGHERRGLFHEAAGRDDEALADYTEAISHDPGMVEAYLSRARVHSSRDDHEAAIIDYSTVLSLAPDTVDAYLGRADAYISMEEYHQALWDYDRALQLDAHNAAAHRGRALAQLSLAEEYSARRRYDRMDAAHDAALAECQRALEFAPDDPWTYHYLGLLFRALDGYDRAFEAFSDALARTPDDQEDGQWADVQGERAETLRLWGEFIHDDDKLRQALDLFDEAAARSMTSAGRAWIHASKGDALTDLRLYREAVEAYAEASRHDLSFDWARVGSGRALYLLDEVDKALEAFAELLARDLGAVLLPWAAVGLGLARERAGDAEGAAEAYSRALGEGEPCGAHVDRGRIFEEFCAFARAEADFGKAVEIDGSSAEAHNALAWLWTEEWPTSDHLEDAVTAAARAVELEKTSDRAVGNYRDTLGWAHVKLGNYESAVAELREAARLAPYDVSIRRHLREAEAAFTAQLHPRAARNA